MSSSKGHVVLPEEVMAEYPVDAIRFWSASASVGDDFPYKEGDLEAGERLLQKLWNASRLIDQLTRAPEAVEARDSEELAAVDRWMLAELDDAVDSLTEKFEDYEFSKARNELRSFFWNTFCDDYLEIAKQRLSDGGDPSAEYALLTAHRTFLKLFAPFLPHVTEELWQRLYAAERNAASPPSSSTREDADDGEALDSVHTTDWPETRGYDADLEAGERAMEVIAALRRYKTDEGLALNADLGQVEVFGDVAGFEDAIAEAMHVRELRARDEAPAVETTIADVDLDYSLVGPEFGERVGDIEAGIASGDFEVEDDRLRVDDLVLEPGMFEIEEERTYSGEGEMIEAGDAVVVVR
jgi:valyl-tRNA synthetase